MTERFRKINLGRTNPKILVAVSIVVVIFLVLLIKSRSSQSSSSQVAGDRIEVASPVSSQDLNKEFEFPLKDNSGKEVSKIKYVLDTAEIRNEIIVQGKKAAAIKGRTFLVLNIKIINDYNKVINVNSRDYVRLSVNGNKNDWFAADVHNDPVEVQPASTKLTRLAFPVNETDKDFAIRLGEIDGEKEEINLTLK